MAVKTKLRSRYTGGGGGRWGEMGKGAAEYSLPSFEPITKHTKITIKNSTTK